PALRAELLDGAEADAGQVEHLRGPEALVRIGLAMAAVDSGRARGFFQRALDSAAGSPPQVRSLQWAGVAAALAETDREWAGQVFSSAAEAALEEPEAVRRVASLAVIADEMAASHPRDAADIFARALEEAAGLDALWEFAHVFDIMFRADRSPYLD